MALTHFYDNAFYDYIEQGSRASARAVIARLASGMEIASVLDVGCGRGAWLSEWQQAGFEDVVGVDGDYVERASLHIAPQKFHARNLEQPFDLGRRFDLVQCLEVAEHLPETAAAGLVTSLARHGDVILFSAAVPGQGGEHHINEQPLGYWRERFEDLGYSVFDFVRPGLKDRREVMNWYRFNTLLYANEAGQARLSRVILDQKIPPGSAIPDRETLGWKFRRLLVRPLPRKLVDTIASARARRLADRARKQG